MGRWLRLRTKFHLRSTIGGVGLLFLGFATPAGAQQPIPPGRYDAFEAGGVESVLKWKQAIVIKSPALRADIDGDIKIQFVAPGMKKAAVLCWFKPSGPGLAGRDSQVGSEIALDAEGNGALTFPARLYPYGPINVRIIAWNDTERDRRELQLFNKAGMRVGVGAPKSVPAGAQGMKLVFEDDFNAPLSISRDGKNARYTSHKPGGGDFSGWPFSDFEGPDNPFAQIESYLRIRASKTAGKPGSTGLISPVNMDGSVVSFTAPVYFECRFLAQSAPGTWPAFWLLTKNKAVGGEKDAVDELDVIEAYGGTGEGNPNFSGYEVTSHFWGQKDAEGKKIKDAHKVIDMSKLGNRSSWSTTFHTYGIKVTPTDTIYYLDDEEVFRHPSGEISKTEPHYFLINYAIGGNSGWKIDLEREGNMSDMYVDYVRVYQGER
jgi:hypothetical protein